MCYFSVVPPVLVELVSKRVLWCPWSPIAHDDECRHLQSLQTVGKASPLAEAQCRQEWKDGRYLFPKILLFLANTSLGYYKSGHVDEWLAATFSHTCSGRAQKMLFSTATLDRRRGGKNRSFLGGELIWSLWCERTLGWLAGWMLGQLVNNAQKKLLSSSCMMEQGASWVPRSPDPLACSLVLCLTWTKCLKHLSLS